MAMTGEEDKELADDLYRRAYEAVAGEGGSVVREVTFEIVSEDVERAARTLERRGRATISGCQVSVTVDMTPPVVETIRGSNKPRG
jgi:hypothetical protein